MMQGQVVVGRGILHRVNMVALLVMLAILVWAFSYQSGSPEILGRYTYRYFAVLLCLILIVAMQLWLWLFAGPGSNDIAANLYTLVISSILAVLLVEAALRVFNPWGIDYFHYMPYHSERMVSHPELGYAHPKGAQYSLGDVAVYLNSKGLRDEEIEYAKPAGERRVVVLGDSVAFGWGVDQDETFSAVMEPLLQQRTGEVWQVINSGVNGYNSEQERIWLELEGMRYDPDIVILVYVRNDTYPVLDPVNNSRRRESGLIDSLPGAIRTIRESSYLYQLTNVFARLQRLAPTDEAWKGSTGADTITTSDGWPESRGELEYMASLLQDKDIPFLVARSSGIDPEFFSQMADAGIPAVTLDRAWLEVGVGDAYVSRIDPHPSAAVHAGMARQLVDELGIRGWLQD